MDMVQAVNQGRLTWQSPSIHFAAAVTISRCGEMDRQAPSAQVTRHIVGHKNRKAWVLMRQACICGESQLKG